MSNTPMPKEVCEAIDRLKEVGEVIDGWGVQYETHYDYANALKFNRGAVERCLEIVVGYIEDLSNG